MDFLSGKAKVGGGRRNLVPTGNEVRPRARLANLTPLLSGIVFVGKAALGETLDFQRVGLGAIDSGNDFIVGLLGPRHVPDLLALSALLAHEPDSVRPPNYKNSEWGSGIYPLELTAGLPHTSPMCCGVCAMNQYELLGLTLDAGSWADWFAGTMSFIAVATALGGYWFAMWSKRQDANERDIQASEALGWKIIQTLNINEHIHKHIAEGFAAAAGFGNQWKFATVRPMALPAYQIADISSGEISSMIRAKAIDHALDLSECIHRLESIRNSMHEYKTRHEALFELLPPPVQGEGTVFSHYLDKT